MTDHKCKACGQVHFNKKMTTSALERGNPNNILVTQLHCKHEGGTYFTQYSWTHEPENWITMMAFHYTKHHLGINDKKLYDDVKIAIDREAVLSNAFDSQRRTEESSLSN